jgi:hypothetical protein
MGVVRWYQVDIRNLTYAELWRISPGAGFLVAAFHKTLHIPLPVGTRVAELDGLDVLGPGGVPEDVASLTARYVEEWESLGFKRAFDYTVPPVSSGMRGYATALLSADATTLAEVVFVEKAAGVILRRELASWCMSCFPDGRRVGATSLRRRMNGPSQFEMTYLTGRPPADLYTLHQHLMMADTRRGIPTALDPGIAQRLIVENNNLSVANMAKRGVYVRPQEGTASPIVPR